MKIRSIYGGANAIPNRGVDADWPVLVQRNHISATGEHFAKALVVFAGETFSCERHRVFVTSASSRDGY